MTQLDATTRELLRQRVSEARKAKAPPVSSKDDPLKERMREYKRKSRARIRERKGLHPLHDEAGNKMCKRGLHALVAGNLASNNDGKKRCRECHRERQREYKARLRANMTPEELERRRVLARASSRRWRERHPKEAT